jgi:hypothetical protein
MAEQKKGKLGFRPLGAWSRATSIPANLDKLKDPTTSPTLQHSPSMPLAEATKSQSVPILADRRSVPAGITTSATPGSGSPPYDGRRGTTSASPPSSDDSNSPSPLSNALSLTTEFPTNESSDGFVDVNTKVLSMLFCCCQLYLFGCVCELSPPFLVSNFCS